MSTVATKSMTLGEGGSALTFAALAGLSLIVFAKAHTTGIRVPRFACSSPAVSLAIFAIVNRYYDRPAELCRRKPSMAGPTTISVR